MNSLITQKILSLVLLLTVAILGAYSIGDHRAIIQLAKYIHGFATDENIQVERYEYGKTPPITLGSIKKSDNAYVLIKLNFRVDSTEGYPNVFQTAPVNRGMRLEISGSTAAIIVPDLTLPSGLKGLTLTNLLKAREWYTLEVEALNGAYVRAKLDGRSVADYASLGLSIETSQILVGGGFDASRAFRGLIEDVSIIKGNAPSSYFVLTLSLVLLIFLLIFIVKFFFAIKDIILSSVKRLEGVKNIALLSAKNHLGGGKRLIARITINTMKTIFTYTITTKLIIIIISFFLSFPLFILLYFTKSPLPYTVGYFGLLFISSVVFFYYLFNTLMEIDDIDENFIKRRSIALLLFTLVLVITSNYVNILSPYALTIGVPFGHFGDFFQLLHLVNISNYSEVTQIGYLPTIVLLGKVVLFFFDKTADSLPISAYNVFVYSLFSLFILFVSTLHAWKNDRKYFFLPLFIVFLLSYPSILQFERGNWVLASLFFLSLFLFNYGNQKLSTIFLSVFILLKILNLFIFPAIFLIKKFNYLYFVIFSIILFVISLLYIYVFSPGGADFSSLLTSVLGTSLHFPDAHIAVAHSGAYAFFRFLFTAGMLQNVTPESFSKYSLSILVLLYLVFVFLFMVIYKVKNIDYDIKEFCFTLLTFFFVAKFFHPNMADMNLILLFPVIVRLTSLRMNSIENLMYTCLVIAILPLHLFPISFVHYSDDAGRIADYWFSAKTYIYSVSYFMFISLAGIRAFLLLRNKSSSKPPKQRSIDE